MIQNQQDLSQRVPKEIQMEFYFYTKVQLQLIYETLNYDVECMEYFLINSKQSIVERVIEEFQRWNTHNVPIYKEVLLRFIRERNFKVIRDFLKGQMEQDDFMHYKPKQVDTIEKTNDQQVVQDATIFILPNHLVIYILDFISIGDLYAFSRTCQEYAKLVLHDPCGDVLFQKFCYIIYGEPLNTVPAVSPFESMVGYVNKNPMIYQPEVINEVNENPRKVVWSDFPQYETFAYAPPQLKRVVRLFRTFKQCYEQGPRIHYCGVYGIEEKYLKIGEANMSQSYAPVHIVEYYRYVRFWSDGTVSMVITTAKLKKQNVMQYLGLEQQNNPNNLQTKKELKVIRGEYVVDLDMIYIKTVVGTSIFNYQLKVVVSKKGPSIYLQVLSATMKQVGEQYIQNLRKSNEGLKFFSYKHIEEFRECIPQRNIGWKQTVY